MTYILNLGGGAYNSILHDQFCVSCGLGMASPQVLGIASSREDIYDLLQRFIDEVCMDEQLIMQLNLLATDIWNKYQTDDKLHLKIWQVAGTDKSRRLTLFFMGLGWIEPKHLTQGDIHRNLGVMLEEKPGSRAILRGFEMVCKSYGSVCFQYWPVHRSGHKI